MRQLSLVVALVGSGLAWGQPPPAPGGQPLQPGTPTPNLNGRPLADWLKDLKDNDVSVRVAAIQAVTFYGDRARAALPDLNYLSGDPDHSVRTAVCIAIGSIGVDDSKDGKEAVRSLILKLGDGQGAIRIQAALAIARIGPKYAHSAVHGLTTLVRDTGSWEIRKTACFALGQVGADPDGKADVNALKALKDALKDRAYQVRLEALTAMVHLGPTKNLDDLPPVLEAVTPLFQDKHKQVQVWSRLCMMRMDGSYVTDANMTPIAKALTDPDPDVRYAAEGALALMGGAAKSKVPDLVAALRSDDLGTILGALFALSQMGKDASSAIANVQPLTQHKDKTIQAAALETIRRLNGITTGPPLTPPGGGPGKP